MTVKNWERYFGCSGPPGGMRGPSTTAGSLAQIPLLETDDLITSGWKTSGHCDWDSQPLARVPVDPPKGLEHGLPN